jgi:hypothetical protein
MIVPVSLFAKARDLAGAPLVHLELLLIALNDEYAVDGRVVPPGTSVSCFPPVSGG